MNKQRRKGIDQIINMLENIDLEEIKDSIQDIIDEEQQTFDDMPENLQQSERAEAMEDAINSLEEAQTDLDGDIMQDIIDLLNQAKGDV
jgi:DNA-binding MurR/RpiR family transcriptional regulator